jgi:hypothetical protein
MPASTKIALCRLERSSSGNEKTDQLALYSQSEAIAWPQQSL